MKARGVLLLGLMVPAAFAQAPAPGLPFSPPAVPAPSSIATFSADLTHYEADAKRWIGNGNVEIRYRGYVLKGDHGEYDEETGIATLQGNVSLDTGRNLILGGADGLLTFQTRNRTWTFSNAETQMQPQGLLSPVRINAGLLSGTRQELTLHDVRVTTCLPPRPQYEITARDVTVIPDRRILAKRATFSLWGRRLVTLPAIVLPVRRTTADRPPVVPQVGQSTEEGVFVKTSLNYAAGRNQSGAVRLDLLQTQGLGLGVVHDYAPGWANGEASIYAVVGRAGRNLSANLRHHQKLLGFSTDLQGELRRNAYQFLPGTTARNAALTMARSVGASGTNIGLRFDGSSGSGSSYRSLASSLAQTYQFTRKGNVSLGLDYTRQSSPGFTSKELASKVDVLNSFGAADVELAANRIGTFGTDTGGIFRPVQRLPELMLRSDARRLGLTRSKTAPVRLQLSTGRFEANGIQSNRQLFAATAPTRSWKVGSARLDLGGGFQQAVYASDAALYTLTGNAQWTQPLGHRSNVSFAYNVQDPRGYTPFRFDRPFAYNSLAGSLRLGDIHGFELRLGSAYDFRNKITPWRDVLGFVRFEPNAGVRFLTNVAVNVNGKAPGENSAVRYVNSTLRLRLGAFHFDGESRYLPGTGKFGRLLGSLDTPVGRRWTVRALVGRDGAQQYRHLLVVRDMGCLEAYVAAVSDRGWRTENGVRVMLRIKAFPVAEPFSTGMFGENLDIGAPDITYGGVASAPLSEPGTGTGM